MSTPLAILKTGMVTSVGLTAPGGGMFFWVELPKGVDAEALLPRAVERGVAFVPGAPFYASEAMKNTLRLSFVTVAPEAIERGVRALAAALETLR